MANVHIRDLDDWVIITADCVVIYEGHRPTRSYELEGILADLGHTVSITFEEEE
jgi:hypothetical protein